MEIPEDKLNAILDRAFDLEGPTLAAYLDEACGNDAALRERVDECLAGANAVVPTDFIGEPVAGMNEAINKVAEDTASLFSRNQFQPGDTIGVYRILNILGEGGMGEVYLAERNDNQFQRKVAIKIVKAGMGTQEVLARFQYERQILANLKHPNIAQLLYGDVTETGLPYFVMEYVEGIPITDYCDQHRLAVRERLELFRTVCDAVRHAQRNQVVHRDLKPSNILVTAEGEVKLLDFGIAKLLAKDGEGERHYTVTGNRSPFTPAYASPEQVNGQPVNAATDVYALGVILYELLTGRRPYELDRNGLTPDNMRLICEHIPTIPSHVVTRRFLNERSEVPGTLSDKRSIEPIKLRRLLRGDVDAIAMKALKKEPELRYPSAAELWSDVNYYLLNRPISARQDSSRYRAIKFLQRHKLSVAAFSITFITIIFGLFISIWQANVATEERDEKIKEAQRANAAWAYLVDLFEAIDPNALQGNEISAADLLKNGLEKIDQLDNQPTVKASILKTIGTAYLNLGEFNEADSLLVIARDLYLTHQEPVTLDVIDTWFKLGQAKRSLSSYKEAISIFDATQSLIKETDESLTTVLNDSRVQSELSLAYAGLRDFKSAKSHAENAYNLAERAVAENNDAESMLNLAISLDRLANSSKGLEAYVKADSLYSRALTIRREILGNQHPKVANTLIGKTSILFYLEDWPQARLAAQEAMEIYAKAHGTTRASVALSQYWLGRIALKEFQLGKAEEHFESASEKYRNAVGNDHPWTIVSDMYLGFTYLELDSFNDSVEVLEDVRDRFVKIGLGKSDKRLILTGQKLGDLHFQMVNYERAEKEWNACLNALGTQNSVWAQEKRSEIMEQLSSLYKLAGKS